jgi:hypothetical protein
VSILRTFLPSFRLNPRGLGIDAVDATEGIYSRS